MLLFETKDFTTIGPYDVYTPGEDIYAEDELHALLALKHHGRRECSRLVKSYVLDVKESNKLVQIDSLIEPSKLQRN